MKIKNKLFLLIVMIIVSLISLTHIFNGLYLEKYYFNIKKKNLLEVAEKIKDGSSMSDLGRIEEGNNVLVNLVPFELISADNSFLYSEEEILSLQKDTDKVIYKKERDELFNNEKLILLTAFDGKRLLSVGTPLSSIQEPMEIITSFHTKIIILSAVIGLIISRLLSVLITKPLMQIEKVAQRVSHLDFSEKINIESQDEIGSLGRSINEMSGHLKSSIEKLNHAKYQLETANEKLHEDIERKRKIDDMRREFLSNVSHELKTPIAVINNYSEALTEGIIQDEKTLKSYLDIIHDETKSMDELVKTLLLLSKLESGYSYLDKKKVNLKTIVKAELEKVDFILEKNTLNLNYKMDEAFFEGDPEKLTIVIRNFISNSLKYTPENGNININISRKDRKNRFEIYNTASIEEDVIEKLWIPFYREDKVRKREEGSGLGLAIIKGILEKHGFDFGAEKYKGGIRFWFEGDV